MALASIRPAAVAGQFYPRDERVLRHLGALELPTQVLVGENDVVAPVDELAAALPAHATASGSRQKIKAKKNRFIDHSPGRGFDLIFERAILTRLIKP